MTNLITLKSLKFSRTQQGRNVVPKRVGGGKVEKRRQAPGTQIVRDSRKVMQVRGGAGRL